MESDSRNAALERRVLDLERSARRTRIAAGIAGAALVALALRPVTTQSAESLRVRRLDVVDDKGVVRVSIGQDPADTQRRSRSCGLSVHDATGQERGGFATFDDRSVVLALDAPRGVGDPMPDRIGLAVAADGSAHVQLIDNQTLVPVRLASDAGGGGGLEFIDYDLDAHVATVKRVTFGGESKQEFPLGEKK